MSKMYANKLEIKERWKQTKGSSVKKINPKAFPILILTVISQCSQNRYSKCFRTYYHSLITLEPFICFHISLVSILIAYFLTFFDPYSIFKPGARLVY